MSMLNIATAALNGATILRVVTRDAVASPGIAVLTDGPQTQRIVQQGDPNGQVNPTNPAAAFYHQLVGQCTAHGLTPQQPQGAAMSQLGRMVLSQAALGYQDV